MRPMLLIMMFLNHQNSDHINQNKSQRNEPDISLEKEQNKSERLAGQKRKRLPEEDDEKPFVVQYFS